MLSEQILGKEWHILTKHTVSLIFIGWLGSSLTSGGHTMGNDLNVLELSKYFVMHIDGCYTRTICLIFLELTAIARCIMEYLNISFLRD